MNPITITPGSIDQLNDLKAAENAFRTAAIIDVVLRGPENAYHAGRPFRFVQNWRKDVHLGQFDDGQGDFFSFVFDAAGAMLRGLVKEAFRAHRESAHALERAALADDSGLPPRYRLIANHDDVTACGNPCTYFLWTRRDGYWSMPTVLAHHPALRDQPVFGLEVLTGIPEAYLEWAKAMHGLELPKRIVEGLFRGTPLDRQIATDLGSRRRFETIAAEVSAMGYPVASSA